MLRNCLAIRKARICLFVPSLFNGATMKHRKSLILHIEKWNYLNLYSYLFTDIDSIKLVEQNVQNMSYLTDIVKFAWEWHFLFKFVSIARRLPILTIKQKTKTWAITTTTMLLKASPVKVLSVINKRYKLF